MALLETRDLTIRFGGLIAVNNVSLEVTEHSITGLIGPNGAGKTTVFNMLTGMYTPTNGDIRFEGRSTVGLRPDQIAALGMARTFQNIRLFRNLTVFENVRTACHFEAHYSLLDAMLRTSGRDRTESSLEKRTHELLELVGLDNRASDVASSLPYGLQRRLEVARALATRPRLLLLDEPAAGMNPQECAALVAFIRDIRQQFDLTVLMIEHHMDVIMNICETMYVLNFGQLLAHGNPEEIQNDPRVVEAYLGEDESNAQG